MKERKSSLILGTIVIIFGIIMDKWIIGLVGLLLILVEHIENEINAIKLVLEKK